jgi:hypothetical protein
MDRIGKLLGAHSSMKDFSGKGDVAKRLPGIEVNKK